MGEIKISARRKAREYGMQALYQWQMSGDDLQQIQVQFHQHHNMSKVDVDYFHDLLHQVPAHVTAIDQLFTPFLDRKIGELNPVELTIIRIGTYELSRRLDVPYRVVINEALGLAKRFGTDTGYKYVNGILDKVAKQCRAAELP